MRGVIYRIYDDRSRLWNVLELHALYSELGGKLCRKRMLSKFTDCLGDNTVLVRLDGFASILGFIEFVGKTLKLVKLDDKDDDTIDGLVKQIRSESQAMAFDIWHLWPLWFHPIKSYPGNQSYSAEIDLRVSVKRGSQ